MASKHVENCALELFWAEATGTIKCGPLKEIVKKHIQSAVADACAERDVLISECLEVLMGEVYFNNAAARTKAMNLIEKLKGAAK